MDRFPRRRTRRSYRSVGRIAAMVVAIVVHLGMLMMLLRPGTYESRMTPGAAPESSALELRLIPPTPPARVEPLAIAATATTTRRPAIRSSPKASVDRVKAPTEPTAQPKPRRINPGSEETRSAQPAAPTMTSAPDQGGGQATTFNDGGFRQQLLNAQNAGSAHGVPGSDRRMAPGIQLTDPMNQGIGSVLRNTQRLFGVTNHHCIDVDVWRSLTPEQLSERHMSLRDVDAMSEKYRCNSPLGLPL